MLRLDIQRLGSSLHPVHLYVYSTKNCLRFLCLTLLLRIKAANLVLFATALI